MRRANVTFALNQLVLHMICDREIKFPINSRVNNVIDRAADTLVFLLVNQEIL